MSETIFALASGHGRSGVAVVRVSGSQSWASLSALCPEVEFSPRMASLRRLIHPETGDILDEALILPFQAPQSYTGEDVVEYQLHGGRAVIESVLDFLASQAGHRLAEPGEFTRRAFENGQMDLVEAEAVADLISAETEAQKAQALSQMGGALSALYEDWAGRLTRALAHMEADIEFPDEDLPDDVSVSLPEDIGRLEDEISVHLNDNRRGERLRDGVQVAVVGAPNAGKSSLVNILSQRDVAITSDLAGTTRDVIEVPLDIGGYPVILADTAGLRPDQIGTKGQEAVESEGIRRAVQRAQDADIVLLVFDGTEDLPDPHTLNLIDERSILVCNKADLMVDDFMLEGAFAISVRTGRGVENLLAALLDQLKSLIVSREGPSLTRLRHRQALDEVMLTLERARVADLPEMMAEDLRLAVRALGKVTGRVDVEDLLDVIFRDFCIGK